MTTPLILASDGAVDVVNEAFDCAGGKWLFLFTNKTGTPTYNGVSMTYLGTWAPGVGATAQIIGWYMEDPPSGSNTIYHAVSSIDTTVWFSIDDTLFDPADYNYDHYAGTGAVSLTGMLRDSLVLLLGTDYTTDPSDAPVPNVTFDVGTYLTQAYDSENSGEDRQKLELWYHYPTGASQTYTMTTVNTGNASCALAIEIPARPAPGNAACVTPRIVA